MLNKKILIGAFIGSMLIFIVFLHIGLNIKKVVALEADNSLCQELLSDTINNRKVTFIKVSLDKGCQIVSSVSASGESLKSLLDKVGGVSGINGAYFCPKDYPKCDGVNTSYSTQIQDWVNLGKFKDDTGKFGTVFAFDGGGKPFIFQKGYDYDSERGDQFLSGRLLNEDRFKDIKYGISNFPLLLYNRQSVLNEYEDVIDTKMRAIGTRNFICSDDSEKIIYLGSISNATIYEVPEIVKTLGCYNAINLDSGGSTALIYKDKYIKGPGRDIMDAFIVVENTGSLDQNNLTDTGSQNSDNSIIKNSKKNNSTNVLKVITNKQKVFIDKQIASFSIEKLEKLLSKIDLLLQDLKLPLKKKNVLNDVRMILMDRLSNEK